MSSSTSELLGVLAALLLAGAAHAQDENAPASAKLPATAALEIYEAPPGVKRLLSLQDIYQLIADRGLPIKVAREDYATAKEAYDAFRDGFYPSPQLTAGVAFNSASSQTQAPGSSESHLQWTKSRAVNYGIGVTSALPFGFGYTLRLPSVTRSDPIDTVAPTPKNEVLLGFDLNLQLLKDSWFMVGDSARTKARWDLDSARLGLRAQALKALLDGEQAFFNLALKELRLRVTRRSIDAAKDFEKQVEAKLKVGEIDRIAAVAAKLLVAQAETAALQGESDLAEAKETLRQSLAMPPAEFAEIYPDLKTFQQFPPMPTIEVATALKVAKTRRPDYLLASLAKSTAELGLKIERQRLLPSLALVYSHNGRGDDEAVGKAISDAAQQKQRIDAIGVQLTYTIWNDIGSHTVKQSAASSAKSRLALEQLDEQLVKELTSLKARIELGYRRLEMSTMGRDLAEQKLSAQMVRFRLGESSAKDLVDAQKDVDTARLDELSTKVDVLSSLSQLRNAQGLAPSGIVMEEK